MKALYRVFIVLAIAGIASLILLHSGVADDSEGQGAVASLSGKCLAVDSMEQSVFIENAAIKTLGGRTFIVGTVLVANNAWQPLENKKIWFPVDKVTSIYAFDSLQEMKDTSAAMGAFKGSKVDGPK